MHTTVVGRHPNPTGSSIVSGYAIEAFNRVLDGIDGETVLHTRARSRLARSLQSGSRRLSSAYRARGSSSLRSAG